MLEEDIKIVRRKDTYPAVRFTYPHPGVRHYPNGFHGRRGLTYYAVISGELDEEDWDPIRPWDWILTGGGGRLFAVSAAEFAERYEIVP